MEIQIEYLKYSFPAGLTVEEACNVGEVDIKKQVNTRVIKTIIVERYIM
jgi:hypothetical protein